MFFDGRNVKKTEVHIYIGYRVARKSEPLLIIKSYYKPSLRLNF